MTQEEKAKAYDEVVARINKAVSDGLVSENFGRDMLGIAESEDERIRKAIKCYVEDMPDTYGFAHGIGKKEMLSYLEKQKEQKPASGNSENPNNQWSEEDEKIRRNLISLLANMRGDRITEETYQKYYPWLKSLRPSWKPSKEQMMRRAANAEITKRLDGTLGVCAYLDRGSGFKFGDKVKLIIVKEESK